MLLVLAVCFVFRRRLNDRLILTAALLFAVGIPFLLPHMHDRYFFAADALSLILVFCVPILAPVAALTQFASLLGYYAYLVMKFLLYMDHGARALLLVLAALWVYLILELRKAGETAPDRPKPKKA